MFVSNPFDEAHFFVPLGQASKFHQYSERRRQLSVCSPRKNQEEVLTAKGTHRADIEISQSNTFKNLVSISKPKMNIRNAKSF
jgi:hypothetical protein